MNNNHNTESLPDWVLCPSCGCEAYWDGAVYFCDQCGWSGDIDDAELHLPAPWLWEAGHIRTYMIKTFSPSVLFHRQILGEEYIAYRKRVRRYL